MVHGVGIRLNFDPTNSALVMVPTLNEEGGIRRVLESMPENFAVLVVDGGSTDGTVEAAERRHAHVITQKFGKGKGCGIRTGMEFFLSTNYDVLCVIDGDGSNDPAELPKMIKVLEDKNADVVLGSRTRGRKEKGAMGPVTFISNLFVSLLLGLRFLRIFTDVQTGYWTFNRKAVEMLYPSLKSKRFEIEMEMFVRTLKAGLRCFEVPVIYRKRVGKTKFKFLLRLRNVGYLIYYLFFSW